jgi:hypothetical protein
MKRRGSKEFETRRTSGKPASAEEISQQLERIVADPVFRKSENLCSILTFLAEESVRHPGVNHKEHEIATRALSRSDDFDPRLDSTVRVHTARLRTKLAEYYSTAGQDDPVVFEIPKGAYQLAARLPVRPQTEDFEEPVEESSQPSGRQRLLALCGWLIAACSIGAALFFWSESRPRNRPPALGAFWADFMQLDEETALIFSTPRMTGSATDGLRLAPSGPIPPELLVETYAGTGEVYGIGALAGLFAQYWRPVRIKRGRLLTWDDARQQNLVFVGGPAVNLQLGELPDLQRFQFITTSNGTFLRDSFIKDARAGASQPGQYGHSSRPYTYDHAVIARMWLASNRKMLLLAGTTTVGTQAAADFVVHEETLQLLLAALKVQPPNAVPPFEALLKVKVSDGVPVHSQVLAVYRRK